MLSIPSDEVIKLSVEREEDSFYRLTPDLQKFKKELQEKLPAEYRVVDWTINRAFVIKKGDQSVMFIDFDAAKDALYLIELCINKIRENN